MNRSDFDRTVRAIFGEFTPQGRLDALWEALEGWEREKDEAYHERNKCVAALARLFPSGLAWTDIPGWDPEWHGCVYIDLPTGQVSWHFHSSQHYLFAGLPNYHGGWDGHDTEEKYRRLAELGQPPQPQPDQEQAPSHE